MTPFGVGAVLQFVLIDGPLLEGLPEPFDKDFVRCPALSKVSFARLHCKKDEAFKPAMGRYSPPITVRPSRRHTCMPPR